MDRKNRGFLTIAQNNDTTDYLRLAYGLALSIVTSQNDVKDVSVLITPGMQVPKHYEKVFDEIIEIPWHDDAQYSKIKFENEWKAYHTTPYIETIKIEADMLITEPIDYWWRFLNSKDLWFTSTVRTYRNNIIKSDACRKVFTSNELPNIYNGFMYFKKNDFCHRFFDTAKFVFQNWDYFSNNYLDYTRTELSTDVAYALTVKLMDLENEVMDESSVPTFVHMKQELMDWNDGYLIGNLLCYLTNKLELKIENYKQKIPYHYHNKYFLTDDMIKKFEAKL